MAKPTHAKANVKAEKLRIPESIYLKDLRPNVIYRMVMTTNCTLEKLFVNLYCDKAFDNEATLGVHIEQGTQVTYNIKLKSGLNNPTKVLEIKKNSVIWLTFDSNSSDKDIKKSDFQLLLGYNKRV